MTEPERYGMTPGEMCYQINRAAAIHEVKTGERPEVIVVSRGLYDVLMRSFLVTAHLIPSTEFIGTEERLFGMRLEVNPIQHGMKFVLGMEFDLDEVSGRRREEHGQEDQGADHPEAGRGADLAVREVPVPDGQLGAEAAGVPAGADDLQPGHPGNEV